MSNKRSRCPNYSHENTMELLRCVKKYSSIIENKRTDAVMWKEKNDAWEKISAEYNSRCAEPRTTAKLRLKYESLKKDARKEASKERQRLLQPEGGPFTPEKANPMHEMLQSVILSANGLRSEGDCDEIVPITQKWVHHTPAMLRQEKNIALSKAMEEVESMEKPNVSRVVTRGIKRKFPSLHPSEANGSFNGESWASSRKELADLQRELLIKEHDARERREEELFSLKKRREELEIKKLELEIKKLS